MGTLEKVQAQIAKLQAQAESLIAKQSSGVLEKIREMMQKHGLTTADIDAHTGGKKRGPKPGVKFAAKSSESPIKYRHPKTGATWTGHGRAPAWIANVKDRSKFAVDTAEAPAPSVEPAKKTTRAGNYVRGPQAPKYRDPKSGASWSGRGRAPAWLVDVKDRSKFLIDDAASGGEEQKPTDAKKTVVKTAAAKKAATKKTAAKKVAAKKAAAKSAPAKKAAKKAVAKKVAAKKSAADEAATAAATAAQAGSDSESASA